MTMSMLREKSENQNLVLVFSLTDGNIAIVVVKRVLKNTQW